MLSVVLPAHNEEELLASTVGSILSALEGPAPHGGGLRDEAFEVIVVENGSTDSTPLLARRLAAARSEVRVLSLPEGDYGRALRAGLLASRGDVVALFDVDYFDLDFLARARAVMDGPDAPVIVVASKRAEGSTDTRAWPRRLVTATFAGILKAGFGLKVSDTHGMKVVNLDAVMDQIRACRLGTDLFDTELILRVERAGMPVGQLPVVVAEMRPSRSPIASRIPRTLVGLARLRAALADTARVRVDATRS
ncbi:MAG: glycosyltransferase family 2 protein [Acidimicrobiales bacterium]